MGVGGRRHDWLQGMAWRGTTPRYCIAFALVEGILLRYGADGVGGPVEVDAEHAEGEADGHGDEDVGGIGEAGLVQQEVTDGGGERGDGVEVAAFKDAWGGAAEDIAEGASADGGGDAEDDGGEPGEAEALGTGGAGDGEEGDGGCVDEEHDALGAGADDGAEREGGGGGEEGGVEVPDVCEGEGWAVLEEEVSDDSAAEGGGEREAEGSDDVVAVSGVLACVEGSADAADGDAGEVERGDEGLEMETLWEHKAVVSDSWLVNASKVGVGLGRYHW